MAILTNISETRDYIKRQLGAPVICVELTNDQIDDIINDSVQDIHRYLTGDGSKVEYMSYQLSANVGSYAVSADLESIVDLEYINGAYGINDLFTASHNLMYNDMMNFNSNFGTGGSSELSSPGTSNGNSSNILTNYNIQMMYLDEISNEFSPKYSCYYDNIAKVLNITPTPTVDMVVLLKVYRRADIVNVYNHSLFKKLSVARARQAHGTVLVKYSMTLPGGGTINGESILNRGITDEEKVMDQIRAEQKPIDFIVG